MSSNIYRLVVDGKVVALGSKRQELKVLRDKQYSQASSVYIERGPLHIRGQSQHSGDPSRGYNFERWAKKHGISTKGLKEMKISEAT